MENAFNVLGDYRNIGPGNKTTRTARETKRQGKMIVKSKVGAVKREEKRKISEEKEAEKKF